MGASFVERNIEYVRFIRYLSAPADSEGIENYFKSIDDYRAIGVLEAKRNQYQNASQSFSLALDREPSDFLSRYFFAEVMFKLGYFERAITEWKLINAASYVERFISDAKLDETEAPYRLYLADTAVRELAPSSPDMHMQLADVYKFRGDLANAIINYQKAVSLEKSITRQVNDLVYLGRALQQSGRQDEALAVFRKVVLLAPFESNSYTQLANQYALMGNYSESLVNYHQALQIDPNNPNILTAFGNFYQVQGNFDLAEYWYNRAVEANPKSGLAEFYFGRLFLEEKRPQDSIVHLNRAIQLGWNSYPVWLESGNAYQSAGNVDAAIRSFHRVSELTDVTPAAVALAQNNLALSYTLLGDYESAKNAWKRVLQIEPDNRKALDALKELEIRHPSR